MTDPARRCRPVEEWPVKDQELWSAAFRPAADVLDDDAGAAAHWHATTRRRVGQAYGRWLTFLGDALDPAAAPAERLSPERLRDYIAELRRQDVASSTLQARIRDLCHALRIMGQPVPDWLKRTCGSLLRRVTPRRDKGARLQSSATLYALGLECMRQAAAYAGRGGRRPATRFRDGLVIALLAARPVRLSNLCAIRIGTHLVRVDDEYRLLFAAAEMKNRRPFEVTLPPQLTGPIDLYLDRYRPVLLGAGRSDRLWITTEGQPLAADTLTKRIGDITQRELGRRVNPHLFRDCLATSVALDDPEHVRISTSLLGHASPATTNRHYNQARSAEAVRRHQENILALRRSLASQETR